MLSRVLSKSLGFQPTNVLTLTARRSLYIIPAPVPPSFSKADIEFKVLGMVLDAGPLAKENPDLADNLATDLLIPEVDRLSLHIDVVDAFALELPATAPVEKGDLASGREIVEWVSSLLEEQGRLKV